MTEETGARAEWVFNGLTFNTSMDGKDGPTAGWRSRKCRFDGALYMFDHTVEDQTGKLVTRRTFTYIFTDDFSMVGEEQDDIDYIKRALAKEFGIKQCNGEHMLGLVRKITDNGTSVEISMPSYIAETYEMFKDDMPKRIPKTPLPPGTFLTRSIIGPDEDPKREDYPEYGKAVGCLLWITRMAKPEIACAVHMLCKMMATPTEDAWKAAMHVLA
jgi:hypothetical protein